jgi:hypothetical protein
MTGPSQLDLISDGKWERAVFFTFALSLTYFETYVLPRLRQAGCQHVSIVVDSVGYRRSMMERRAKQVGLEYSVIPVHIPGGIFHPKVTYLWGDSSPDLLLVGSGNLTYGGHGRNLEVIEALSSQLHAAAFSDFSAFVDALKSRPGATFGDTELLEVLSMRAAKVSHDGGNGDVRLVHSVVTPIAKQLLEASRGKIWNELFVLSPFFSESGAPFKELVEALGISQLLIAVSPVSNKTSFNFELSKSWGVDVRAVKLCSSEERRPFHAKWVELRGDTTMVVTGSVNATVQSMGSTKNIELAVLRLVASGCQDLWCETDRPIYQPDHLELNPDQATFAVFAEMNIDGEISGRIIGPGNLSGRWRIGLENEVGKTREGEVEVIEDGRFRWEAQGLALLNVAGGSQLWMSRESFVARGWLNAGRLLRLASSDRRALGALKRLLERSETADDLQAFVDYLTMHVHRAMCSLPTKLDETPPKPTIDAPEDDLVVPLAELLDLGTRTEEEHFQALASGSNSDPWAVLETLTHLLLGRRSRQVPTAVAGRPGEEKESDAAEDAEDERAKRARQREVKNAEDALTRFREAVKIALKNEACKGANRARILLVWGTATLDMLLLRLGKRDDAERFLRDWFHELTWETADDASRVLLDEVTFGAAAALVGISFESRLAAEDIHESLERYLGSDVDIDEALATSERWLTKDCPGRLVGNTQAEWRSLFTTELKKPSRRKVLSTYLDARLAGNTVQQLPEQFTDEERRLFSQVRVAGGKANFAKVDLAKFSGCPRCYVGLSSQMVHQLRSRRIARCLGFCNTILVNLNR